MQQNMNLSMTPYNQAGAFVCSQYDVGRTCQIQLVDDNGAYEIPTGATVTVMATKPSGLGFSVECTWSGSTVTFTTTNTMTNEFGRFPAEIRIEKDSLVLGTTNFFFKVERSPHPDEVIDGDVIIQKNLVARVTTLEAKVATAEEDITDLKADINDIKQGGGSLTEDVKVALLDCVEHIGAWSDGQGRDYYDALYNALYPPANLTQITAVYTQSGTVYDNQTLDSLKSDLIVTAIYDDGTSESVTTYTLSGTLATGTSTITVAYGGKTATFTVTVTHAVAQYSITNNLTNCTNSNSATVVNEETAYSGTLTVASGYIMSAVTITMGGTDVTSTAYDSETSAISIASVTGNVVITAEAIEDVGWISGVAYDLTEYPNKQNMMVDTTSDTGYSSSANSTATDKLPCHGANAMYLPDGYANRRGYYNEDGSGLSQAAMNSTWGAQNWIPVVSNAYYFACSNYTSNLPLTATVVPYKLTTLGENVAVEVGEHYAVEKDDTSYMFCYGMATLKLVYPARRKIDFYDGNKQLLSTTGAQNNLITASIPDGAMYFKFDSDYGTSQNIAWFEAE